MSKDSKSVFVGLSGGVDSSVAALLLQKQGYRVTGVFIKAWQPEGMPCTWREDRLSAMRAAAALKIPFRTWDLGAEYKALVVDHMIEGYARGETPNPDILCNEKIKFGHFAKKAFEQGADFVATGHYARLRMSEDGTPHLLEGVDQDKDQSYFLARVSGEVLARTLFPIGEHKKSAVRNIARAAHLPTASRPDSQGLCFMGELDVKAFLKESVPHVRGEVRSLDGSVVGYHEGSQLYTLGERHGFTVTDATLRQVPLYIVKKEVHTNILVVGPRETAHATTSVLLRDLTEINKDGLVHGGAYDIRFRYHQTPIPGMFAHEGRMARVEFEVPVTNASPGQTLVLYKEGECLGSGILVAE